MKTEQELIVEGYKWLHCNCGEVICMIHSDNELEGLIYCNDCVGGEPGKGDEDEEE